MHMFKCAYCGQEYTATRSDSVYCSSRCRVCAHRNKQSTFPVHAVSKGITDLGTRRAISQKRVDMTFVNLRGNAAELDAAAMYGPVETRQACRVVCDDVRASLGKVGM